MLSTQEAAEKLSSEGVNSTSDEVAKLSREGVFPNAEKVGGKWQIPPEDISDYLKKEKSRRTTQARRWITTGSILTIITVLTLVSVAKDGLDLVKDYVLPHLIYSTPNPTAEAIAIADLNETIYTPVVPTSDSKIEVLTSTNSITRESTPISPVLAGVDITDDYFYSHEETDFDWHCQLKGRWNPYPPSGYDSSYRCFEETFWVTMGDTLILNSEIYFPIFDSDRSTIINDDDNIWGGIYAPIPKRATIELEVFINSLNFSSIQLGVIPHNAPSLSEAILLLFVELDESEYGYPAIYKDAIIKPFPPLYEAHEEFTGQVRLEIEDDIMKMYINDELMLGPIDIPYTERDFWIGYSVNPARFVKVHIRDIKIIER